VDPREAGRGLNVRAIVTGRVVQRGDQLTVQVQLIDTQNVAQVWGDQFNRPLADALALQAEISRAIAAKLIVRLTIADERNLAAGTRDAVAYQLYLKGRHEWNTRGRDSLARAAEYFEQAIEHDPSYVRAYAGLAGAYTAQGYFGYLRPEVGFPKGIAAARKALSLDDRSADAHSALATATLYYDWNWSESEREHLQAIRLEPTNADAHFRYGATFLRSVGRYDEAIEQFKLGAALDPGAPSMLAGLGQTLTYARRYDDAIEAFKQAFALEPDLAAGHRDLAAAYRLKGLGDLAIEESRRTIKSGEPSGRASLAQSYLVAGRKADALAVLKELIEEGSQSRGEARGIAIVFAALGDANQACQWLEQAFKEKDPNLVFLSTGPEFETLRADARFEDLVRRVGIPAR